MKKLLFLFALLVSSALAVSNSDSVCTMQTASTGAGATTNTLQTIGVAMGWGSNSSAATSATTGTMTVTMNTDIVTCTPTGACTFNGSGGSTGMFTTFVFTTSGTSSFVMTWGTNYKTTATLATGTTTAKTFAVTFRCTNGTQWVEIARTTAM